MMAQAAAGKLRQEDSSEGQPGPLSKPLSQTEEVTEGWHEAEC